jgi:tRNA uridine 5-carboxymethylaminomethyl modification enzyme
VLRQDNADIRLTEKGFKLGLADQTRHDNVEKKKAEVAEIIAAFSGTKLTPEEINPTLAAIGTAPLREKISLAQLLKRPQISIDQLTEASPIVETLLEKFGKDSIHQAEINLKYDSYIEKEMLLVEKMNKLENLNIIENFNYDVVTSLSFEGREKLKRTRPQTIGQASRISGVSPSDISVLMLFIGR